MQRNKIYTEASIDKWFDKFILSPQCTTENRGYFADGRVDSSELPEGWYVYDFIDTEYGNIYAISQNKVFVNFGGTFITKKPLKFNKDGLRYLSGRGGYTFA